MQQYKRLQLARNNCCKAKPLLMWNISLVPPQRGFSFQTSSGVHAVVKLHQTEHWFRWTLTTLKNIQMFWNHVIFVTNKAIWPITLFFISMKIFWSAFPAPSPPPPASQIFSLYKADFWHLSHNLVTSIRTHRYTTSELLSILCPN